MPSDIVAEVSFELIPTEKIEAFALAVIHTTINAALGLQVHITSAEFNVGKNPRDLNHRVVQVNLTYQAPGKDPKKFCLQLHLERASDEAPWKIAHNKNVDYGLYHVFIDSQDYMTHYEYVQNGQTEIIRIIIAPPEEKW